VVLVTEPFETVARSSAAARGYGKLPIVVLPANFDELTGERLRALVATRLDDVEAALRRGRA
jgi:hypothetical protein